MYMYMFVQLALCVVERSFIASLAVPVVRIMYVQGGMYL